MASKAHDNHAQEHHVIPLATYFKVLSLLLILTGITVAAAQVNFGPWNTVIAMLIASIKAGFVLAFFMHLKYDNKLYLVCFGTGIFFLAVLYFFSDLDILTRISVDSIL
jgi:cytochrome c oxidase subunit IV